MNQINKPNPSLKIFLLYSHSSFDYFGAECFHFRSSYISKLRQGNQPFRFKNIHFIYLLFFAFELFSQRIGPKVDESNAKQLSAHVHSNLLRLLPCHLPKRPVAVPIITVTAQTDSLNRCARKVSHQTQAVNGQRGDPVF